MISIERVAVVAGLAVGLGCGPSDRPATTPKAATEEGGGPLAPLTVHRAQSARHAIILGTNAGSHKIPLAERENSVGVDVLWYQMSKPPKGGTSPIRLRVAPQTGGDVRVGVFEQYSGGVGSMSRASVWIAAFLASTTLGQDLASFRFTAEVNGFVDGPSAGALLAAGYLAALTNTPVDPEATMTGAVNPDGTVGPVGGIPRKFEAAIDLGKKRLGFPLGQRLSVDPATGGKVDLVELAKRRGATAVELRDIHDAYKLLTGRTLPRPTPVSPDAMAIPAAVNAALTTHYARWNKLYDHHWSQVAEGLKTKALPPEIKALATAAGKAHKLAEAASRDGRHPSAYAQIVDAVIYAHTARLSWAVIEDVRAGRIDDAMSWIRAQIKTFEGSVATMNQIGVLHPTTIGGHLQMISAFQRATAALAYATWGQQQLSGALLALAALRGRPPEVLGDPKTSSRIASALSVPLVNFVRAEITARVATEALEIEAVDTIESSLLISRWYSLGVERDRTTGVAKSVKHREAFDHALETAERSAREHAHSAQVAVGRIPLQAQLAYQRGRSLSRGDLDAKLRALEAYWAASGYSQTAVVMARHVINPKKHGAHGR